MTHAGLIDVGEIAALLSQRAEALARHLIPGGHREGAEWVDAHKAQGGEGSSLTVRLRGAKAGIWAHYAAGPGVSGDALDLVAYLQCGGDKGRAVNWARAWLGLDQADPATLATARRRAGEARAAAERGARDEAARKSRAAFALWLSGAPRLAGTPAEAYLKGRGIDLAVLGRQPRALRYHGGVLEPETGLRLPCLLAKIDGPDGMCLTVHRTWLAQTGEGRWVKADAVHPIKKSKKVYGPYKGGGIRLWNGERIDAKTGEVKRGHPLARAPAGSTAVLVEGIEDGLSVAVACPEYRILAAVSLANLGNLAQGLPRAIDRIILCADNDAPGGPAAASLDRAARACLAGGRRVSIVRPPAGIKDVNELLNQNKVTA